MTLRTTSPIEITPTTISPATTGRRRAAGRSRQRAFVFDLPFLRFDPAPRRIPFEAPALTQRIHSHAQHDVCCLTGFDGSVRVLPAADAVQEVPDMAGRGEIEAPGLLLL